MHFIKNFVSFTLFVTLVFYGTGCGNKNGVKYYNNNTGNQKNINKVQSKKFVPPGQESEDPCDLLQPQWRDWTQDQSDFVVEQNGDKQGNVKEEKCDGTGQCDGDEAGCDKEKPDKTGSQFQKADK